MNRRQFISRAAVGAVAAPIAGRNVVAKMAQASVPQNFGVPLSSGQDISASFGIAPPVRGDPAIEAIRKILIDGEQQYYGIGVLCECNAAALGSWSPVYRAYVQAERNRQFRSWREDLYKQMQTISDKVRAGRAFLGMEESNAPTPEPGLRG